MSKGLAYFLGIVTGVLLTFGGAALVNRYGNNADGQFGSKEKQDKLPDGVTMLDEPVPFTEAKNFKILQVVGVDAALAQSEKKYDYINDYYYTDPIVLLLSDVENSFYDDQIIKSPKGGKVMQVGTYNYQTKLGWKTVPIVKIIKE